MVAVLQIQMYTDALKVMDVVHHLLQVDVPPLAILPLFLFYLEMLKEAEVSGTSTLYLSLIKSRILMFLWG